MKHIKLFEQISSELPKVFSTEEIKNMTEDEFFRVMEMYYKESNSKQAYTLLQVWIAAHPEAPGDWDWSTKLSKYTDLFDPIVKDFDQSKINTEFHITNDFAGKKVKWENGLKALKNWIENRDVKISGMISQQKRYEKDLETLKKGPSYMENTHDDIQDLLFKHFKGEIPLF